MQWCQGQYCLMTIDSTQSVLACFAQLTFITTQIFFSNHELNGSLMLCFSFLCFFEGYLQRDWESQNNLSWVIPGLVFQAQIPTFLWFFLFIRIFKYYRSVSWQLDNTLRAELWMCSLPPSKRAPRHTTFTFLMGKGVSKSMWQPMGWFHIAGGKHIADNSNDNIWRKTERLTEIDIDLM